MKVLLLGATGLIGPDLLSTLLEDGHFVFASSRSFQQLTHKNLSWITTDFTLHGISHLLDLPAVDSIILNAASLATTHFEDTSNQRSVNIELTEKILASLHHWKPQKILYMSSFNFLQKPIPPLITENAPLAPLTFYGLSKYWSELLLTQYSSQKNVVPIIFRVSSPVSFDFNRLHQTVVKKMILNAQSGQAIHIYGSGSRSQNFIATKDIARAALLAIKSSSAQGIYNIASQTPLSMLELAQIISQKYGTPIESLPSESTEEQWNISSQKAIDHFSYTPLYSTSKAVIQHLLNCLPNENRNS